MEIFGPGEAIIQEGDPVNTFYIITDGTVNAVADNHSFLLKKGDIVGIFDITAPLRFFSYHADTKAELIDYHFENTQAFLTILKEQPDICKLMMMSLLHNTCTIIDTCEADCKSVHALYRYLIQSNNLYHATCRGLSLLSKTLPFIDELLSFTFEEELPFWMKEYYVSFGKLIGESKTDFTPDFIYGFLSRSSMDIEQIITLSTRMNENEAEFSDYLLNEDYLDFFDLYCDLFFRAKAGGFDASIIDNSIKSMISQLRMIPYINKSLVVKRVTDFQQKAKDIRNKKQEHSATDETLTADLSNSVNIILDYADTMPVTAAEFKKYLELFKQQPDKNSMDKKTEEIRVRLTRLFYLIYSEAFQISLKTGKTPPIVKMFLNFGFMDPALCGYDNAVTLYNMIDSYHGNKEQGIYTIYEWILEIYRGNKQPSRNEFEQDYAAFVRNLKKEGKLDRDAEQNMTDDTVGKVMYELQNMLPSVNKITFGRVFTFCPILLEENLCKPIQELLLTPKRITTVFDRLSGIDYSAFYHDVLFEEPSLNLKENIIVDIRPDVILMPNAGSKGILWQEIEGMYRTTNGRMMISAFHIENVEKTFINMIGEFRWEMCKRTQGGRWNDVTSHSLTSDYCDYAQFYQKNRELSYEAKEKIKTNLKRCKNNYRALFLTDYMAYMLYESTGSCRLNKVCRSILFRYCPLGKGARNVVAGNAIFTDCLERHKLETARSTHRINQIILKYQNGSMLVPDLITAQTALLEK